MYTWRNSTLAHEDQTLVRDGLAVEYAPGKVCPRDLSSTPGLRAWLVCPLLPRGAVPATLTAFWIHTGLWPSGRVMRLCAAHPTHSRPPVVHRAELPGEFAVRMGGHAVPSPARTAYDLLAIERPDTAIECVLGLLHSCLGIEELRDQCELEGRRRNAPFVRRCVDGLADYVERTAFRETGRPVGSAGSRADDARRP